jgi:hypothetical protein
VSSISLEDAKATLNQPSADTLSFQSGFEAVSSTEVAQEGGPVSTGGELELNTACVALANPSAHITCRAATGRALSPRLTPNTSVAEERSYDRPGKKPAAYFQRDPLKLQESCRQAGGSPFAVDWIVPIFKYGVTTEALVRVLKRKEIDEMNFAGGFRPHQAYDGFISKAGQLYECGLCKEGRRTHWKNKKDAPRHLRKFHFGLADVCKDW